MSMNPHKPYLGLILIFVVVSSSFSSLLLFADTVFTDGFEANNFNLWDGNGATGWNIGTYGSGTGGAFDPPQWEL